MTAQITTPEKSTVTLDNKEFSNMRNYCMQKQELFHAQYTSDNKVLFTANTFFLAFCGFLDF